MKVIKISTNEYGNCNNCHKSYKDLKKDEYLYVIDASSILVVLCENCLNDLLIKLRDAGFEWE